MSNARDKANIPALNFSSTGIDDNATSTAITINSSEQLAIGTTSFDQDAKLVVAGSGTGGSNPSTISANTIATFRRTGGLSHTANISIIGGSTGSSIINFGDRDDEDVGRLIYDHTNNYFSFNTNTTERMRIDSSGKVMVGTTTADGVLKLDNTGQTSETLLTTEDTGGSGAHSHISLKNTTGVVASILTTSDNLEFRVADATVFANISGTERMRITGSGSVGIGTSSPGTVPLNVVSTDGGNVDDILELRNNSTTTGTGVRLRLVSSTDVSSVTNSVSISSYRNAGSDHDMLFESSGSEKMRIRSTGLVGIGTSSPSSLLHIESDSADPTLRITNKTLAVIDTGPDIEFWNNPFTVSTTNSYESGAIRVRKTNGSNNNHDHYMSFWTRQNSPEGINERMRIDGGGIVRINNTANATYASQLNIYSPSTLNCGIHLRTNTGATQSQIIFGNSNNDSVGSISTSGTSTAYNTSSDYRLKENVSYDFDATTRLKQLKPARFNFIADADTTVDGFIAHEVSDIVPEAISGEKDAVNEDGSIQPQGIDQSKLVPLLVKTIQELEARITALETNNP